VIVIEDLLVPDGAREYAAKPEMDPLTEEDALLEAQLLDLRFDVLRSSLALLFELRLALQLREGNTGVLVAHGVRRCGWSANARMTDKTAWTVVGSVPRAQNQLFNLRLAIHPYAEFDLAATSAAFYTGDVPGLVEIPDYGQDDEVTIRAGLASWVSQFSPIHAVFLDPAPGD